MPDIAALKAAVRAAIVIPAVFAFADKVIQQPQTSIFAALGSFAMLVLDGPARRQPLSPASASLERGNAARTAMAEAGRLRRLRLMFS